MTESETGISMPETESAGRMTYSYDLPHDDKSFTIDYNEDGTVAELKIYNEDESIEYEHRKSDGEIDTVVLRNELKGLGLQEMSISSVLEKFKSVT